MPFDYEAIEAELNGLGEAEVRKRYSRDEYLSHNIRHRYVQDWLRRKDDERAAERIRSEHWRAVRTEIIATVAAIAAIIAAVAAFIDAKP